MCWLPIAALKNYHKLSGLKYHNVFYYNSADHKLKMTLTGLKSSYQQGCVLCGGSRGESISAFSSL